MTVRSYTTKPERVFEISLEFQPPNTITRFFILLFFLLPFTNTKHCFPLPEACGTSVQDYMKIIPEAKREPPISRIHLLKRRRR
jgi:hypothetical protein